MNATPNDDRLAQLSKLAAQVKKSEALEKPVYRFKVPVWFRMPDDEDADDLPESAIHLRRRSDWVTYRSSLAEPLKPDAIAQIAVEELVERDVSDWMDADDSDGPVVIVTVGATTAGDNYRRMPTDPPTDGSFGELVEFAVEVDVSITARAKPYTRPTPPEERDPLLPEAIPYDPRQGQLAFDDASEATNQ